MKNVLSCVVLLISIMLQIGIIGSLIYFLCVYLCMSCISWKSQLQSIVALSTTEFEYIDIIDAIKEVICLKGILSEISFLCGNVIFYSDNQSAIQICQSPAFHDRTKHIAVKFHYIRDVERKQVFLEKIPTECNSADIQQSVYLLTSTTLGCVSFSWIMGKVNLNILWERPNGFSRLNFSSSYVGWMSILRIKVPSAIH